MKSWINLAKPIIGLSPMADYTDKPYSLICKKFGVAVIFREMVSADAIVHGNKKTFRMIEIDKAERSIIQQIFGRDPMKMAAAAKKIYETVKPDGIDINMGCPATKVVKNFHGAALMKEPKLAMEIISAVKKAVPVPVSVKTRLGWSNKEDILKFAPLLQEAGADLITIHGRTKTQGYTGVADWEMIARAKETVTIPVLANGSIFETADINKALEITKCEGVLIARGALGNPWIFHNEDKRAISPKNFVKTILEHAELQTQHYSDYGMILFRKHLMFYFKNFPHAKETKIKLTQVESLDELKEILQEFLLFKQNHNIS